MQTNCTRDLIVAIRYNAPGISSVDNHAALLSPRSTVNRTIIPQMESKQNYRNEYFVLQFIRISWIFLTNTCDATQCNDRDNYSTFDKEKNVC